MGDINPAAGRFFDEIPLTSTNGLNVLAIFINARFLIGIYIISWVLKLSNNCKNEKAKNGNLKLRTLKNSQNKYFASKNS